MAAAGPRSFRSSRAFLVRASYAGEADRRVTLFTEEAGLVTLLAKSAGRSRRRFGGTLQKYLLLSVAWTETPGRPAVLGSSEIRESFWNVASDLERVCHADHLLELSAALFPQPGPKPRAFALLLALFRLLARDESPSSVARKAEASLLHVGGWGPDLRGCRRCGARDRVPFRILPPEGVLFCRECTGKGGNVLSAGAVKTWRALQEATPASVGRIKVSARILDELQPVMSRYLEWHIGKPLRSLSSLGT